MTKPAAKNSESPDCSVENSHDEKSVDLADNSRGDRQG